MATNDLRLAVGRNNGDIEIWNPKFNWTHEITLYGSKGTSVEGLCWAVNDEDTTPRLFSIGGSTYITEWDLSTGLPKINYDCNVGVIWSMAINKSNTKLAVGSDDGSVCIVDISGGFGSLEHDMICQRQDLRVLSLSWYENDLVIGGCADARIRCWSVSKDTRGRIMGTMRVDKSKTESTLVWSVNVLPTKRQIISGDSTGSVKVWDLNTFTLLQSFNNHEADVLCITNDLSEEKVFTAGVDRKIHQYNLVNASSNKSKWVHSYNRLLHSNDVRSMAVYESKGYNFLVSGGVEKSIVIQSINLFHDGKYRKLSLCQQQSNIAINSSKKLVVMFQDQQVKIWSVGLSENYKLVAKMVLSDDDNITKVSLNESADLLAVATLSSVKLFHLTPVNNKMIVSKIRDTNFDVGAKSVVLVGETLIVLTSSDELYKFNIDVEEQKVELVDEIELPGSLIKSNIPYINNIKSMICNKDVLILTRFNGAIEVVNLSNLESYKLAQLSSTPHLTEFSQSNTLIVVTDDNKIHEFFIKNGSLESILTPWSKRNTEFLPKQFLTLDDKPEGIFVDQSKVWLYGKGWLCFFDMTMNIPINKAYKNMVSKKRNRDGLTIDEDEDDEDEEETSMELSLRQSQVDKMKQEDQETNDNDKPYWISFKYRPIIAANKLGDDLIIIERPSVPTGAAFKLPKIKV